MCSIVLFVVFVMPLSSCLCVDCHVLLFVLFFAVSVFVCLFCFVVRVCIFAVVFVVSALCLLVVVRRCARVCGCCVRIVYVVFVVLFIR